MVVSWWIVAFCAVRECRGEGNNLTGVLIKHLLFNIFPDIIVFKDKDKDKDLFIGPQEFVVGYSKAPEQPQSSARPICHSHSMTRTGREPATIRTAA